MYAIAFDMDTDALRMNFSQISPNNAYKVIQETLKKHGFNRQQGSVYFGDKETNAVACVLAVQDLSNNNAWFKPSVVDIRMLRIEEQNDLKVAL